MIGTPLFTFEYRAKGILRRLIASHFAQHFWLEMEGASDWLALVGSSLFRLKEAYPSGNQLELRAQIEKAVVDHNILRAFEWRENDEKLFVLWQSNGHYLLDPQSGEPNAFTSQTDWHKASIWTQPSAHFASRFALELANPNCDARAALAFLRASPLERERFNVVWTRGGWPEVEQVIGAALRIEFDQTSFLQQLPEHYAGKLVWLDQNHVRPTGRLQRLLEVVDERNVRSEPELTDGAFAMNLGWTNAMCGQSKVGSGQNAAVSKSKFAWMRLRCTTNSKQNYFCAIGCASSRRTFCPIGHNLLVSITFTP